MLANAYQEKLGTTSRFWIFEAASIKDEGNPLRILLLSKTLVDAQSAQGCLFKHLMNWLQISRCQAYYYDESLQISLKHH